MADYINIPVDFFEQETIEHIRSMPDGDGAVVLYLQLLCETHKKNSKGVFAIGNVTLTDYVLGCVFPCEGIGTRLAILETYGLIKRTEKSVRVFKFWDDLHDRNSQRYKEWRSSVFVRDGFRCAKCGTKKDLQAHHKRTWKKNKELRYEVSNGITLCRSCHLEAHGGCWKNGE